MLSVTGQDYVYGIERRIQNCLWNLFSLRNARKFHGFLMLLYEYGRNGAWTAIHGGRRLFRASLPGNPVYCQKTGNFYTFLRNSHLPEAVLKSGCLLKCIRSFCEWQWSRAEHGRPACIIFQNSACCKAENYLIIDFIKNIWTDLQPGSASGYSKAADNFQLSMAYQALKRPLSELLQKSCVYRDFWTVPYWTSALNMLI